MTLYQEILDAIVEHRLVQQGERRWLTVDGRLDRALLPPHLRGPVEVMTKNALPLVDRIVVIIVKSIKDGCDDA